MNNRDPYYEKRKKEEEARRKAFEMDVIIASSVIGALLGCLFVILNR